MKALVSTWYGTFLLDGSRVLKEARPPMDATALAERQRVRSEGRRTPEEETVLAERRAEVWSSADRRLVGEGVVHDPRGPPAPPAPDEAGPHRAALLAEAERALQASWDPSVHVEEAVRAARDLDRAANLIGERLSSWAARDAPESDVTDPERAESVVLDRAAPSALAPADPRLGEARRRLAELHRSIRSVRSALDGAIQATVPQRTPNLHSLLGADLTARLLAQARGLARLARLPASTIQVLGAEKAFFEHLRGRAPPPRHGLLFLHPAIQSSSRAHRGRLARTLAAKTAIAARLDAQGSPLAPALSAAFERRRDELKKAKAPGRRPPGRRGRSRSPLDRASHDR